jgi:hypothetical protein
MEILVTLKRKLKIFVEKSPNLWSNFHWIICWYERNQKIVEVAHKTMLENLIPLNVYLKINLKGESFDLGQYKIYIFFIIHYFSNI